jgi:hypothetical protein
MWGNPVSPRPRPREGLALKQGMGKPGFPIPSPGGQVWEGCALPETTFSVGVRRSRLDGRRAI